MFGTSEAPSAGLCSGAWPSATDGAAHSMQTIAHSSIHDVSAADGRGGAQQLLEPPTPEVVCWTRLSFDSDVFKLPVARIPSSVTVSHLFSVLQQCTAAGVQLAYWSPPDPLAAAASLPWFSGFLASSNTLLRRPIAAAAAAELAASTDTTCSDSGFFVSSVPAGPACQELVHLGFVAGQHSRFRLDPSLSRAQVERLYTAWVNNSTQRKVADEVLAVYEQPASQSSAADSCRPVGFISMKLPAGSSTASIGLLAVSPESQRRGVGGLLMSAALRWAAAAGASSLEVVTQEHNSPVMAFYTAHGFVQERTTPTYHIWLDVKQRVVQNLPYFTGSEMRNLSSAIEAEDIRSCGTFTTKCQRWMEQQLGASTVLLTGAGTTALEQAALLCDFQPGDEAIMPSYTFVSTANAFVLRGATPVFVDVRGDTLNIDATTIATAVTPRTRVIVVVHYAGVACDMDPIMALAKQHGLLVVEDAAHAFLSTYKGRALGTIGHFGCLSFHYTKNVTCGEGGALIVNDPGYLPRAYVTWEKGTNRFDFINKKVDKYQWLDLGSSFVPSELAAAFLLAQLEHAHEVNACRRHISATYHKLLQPLEAAGELRLMPREDGTGCGHIFWLLLPSVAERDRMQAVLGQHGVEAYSHYVPLHLSDGGKKWGRSHGDMQHTIVAGSQLLRLPMWPHMTCMHVHQVVAATYAYAGRVPCPLLSRTVQMFAGDWVASIATGN